MRCCAPPLIHARAMQLSWLLDINGIPRNWRALEGHGVNTFTLVNQVRLAAACPAW